jgi:iron complex transport system permease protein
MTPTRLNLLLGLAVLALALAGLMLGEIQLTKAQIQQALTDPTSGAHDVLFRIRLPRTVAALVVGAALGLAGAVMQGLLRNPLADPGVLGVSGGAGLGAAIAIALGLAGTVGAVEGAALVAALATGGVLTLLAARFREPETLILFGVALSAFLGALTSLVFNLAPSPVTLSEVFAWLLGSVANRDWTAIVRQLPAMALGAGLCVYAAKGLLVLTLGEETAALSGLPMARRRAAAVAGAALLTGASVAMAGIVGFVGLAAPHLVRSAVGGDPVRILLPSALAGSVLLAAADIVARLVPSDLELKLGVVTALFGAPLFGLIAWRAARSWRG